MNRGLHVATLFAINLNLFHAAPSHRVTTYDVIRLFQTPLLPELLSHFRKIIFRNKAFKNTISSPHSALVNNSSTWRWDKYRTLILPHFSLMLQEFSSAKSSTSAFSQKICLALAPYPLCTLVPLCSPCIFEPIMSQPKSSITQTVTRKGAPDV